MPEMKRETFAQVQGDEIAFKSLAGLLERLFVVRTNSEDIVSRTEGLMSMVLRGVG